MSRSIFLIALVVLAIGGAGCGSSRISSISVDHFVKGSTPPSLLRDRVPLPDRLYFATADHGWMIVSKHTYETRNGGKTWRPAKTELSAPGLTNSSGACGHADVESVSFWSSENGYSVCGAFSYTDEGGFPQYHNSLRVTDDGGVSWHRCEGCHLGDLATTIDQSEDSPSPSLQIHFFDRDHGLISPRLSDPSDTSFENGNAVGIYATSTGGASWRLVGFGTLGRSSSWPTWRDGYITSRGGPLGNAGEGIYVTHDAGASWKKIWPASVRPVNAISYSSSRVAIGAGSPWAAGVSGEDPRAILRSDDGGLHWRRWGSIRTKGYVREFVRFSAKSLLAVTNEKFESPSEYPDALPSIGLFRSDDNGRSWRELSTPSPAYIFEEATFNEGGISFSGTNGYAAGESGGIESPVFVTNDGGKSWQKIEFKSRNRFESLAALGGRRLLGTTKNGSISSSSDGGRTWRKIPLFVHGKPYGYRVDIISVDALHIWITEEGAFSQMFASSDGGRSWEGISLKWSPGVPFEARLGARLYFSSAEVGFFDFGPEAQQLVSRDGGRTWTGLPFSPAQTSLSPTPG